jgi:iron complex outermembrane recepter protein
MAKRCVALSLGLGLVLILGGIPQVFAQESGSEEFTLEEITVTAQKRSENQQKVPIAMDTITGDEITELGKTNLNSILDNIASVLINTASDGYRVSIRGMSNDNSQFQLIQASTPTVAVNTDGVYTNRNDGGQGLYDVSSVEVLYGPQSTMYASASPGGIVNIATSNPKTDRFSVSGSVEAGSYSLLRTQGSLNVPLTDKIAVRAAFATNKHDGYLSNGTNDEDTKSARLKTLFQPTDNLSIMLTGEISKVGGLGFSGVTKFVNQDDVSDPWTSTSTSIMGNSRNQTNKKYSANMNWDMGYAGTLTVIPSYSPSKSDQAAIQAAGGMSTSDSWKENETDMDEKGLEARMASSADFPFTWILGFNVYKSTNEQLQQGWTLDSNDELVDDVMDTMQYTTNKQTTKATFANVTYPVTDKFRATLGGRMTWDNNTSYNYELQDNGSTRTDNPSPMEYSSPNYKVGAEYDLADNSMLYGDVSTSYRTQGMSFSSSGTTYPPEKLLAFSAGAKNRFFGKKLQLNVSAFYYRYRNYLAVGDNASSIVDYNNNGYLDSEDIANYAANGNDATDEEASKAVGAARFYGLDLQTSTIITTNDRVDLSVSYLRKYFKHLYFDYSYMANDMGLTDFDYSGEQMPNSPKWSIDASYSHMFNMWNGGSLTAKLEAKYRSSYVLNYQSYTITQVQGATSEPYFYISDATGYRDQEAYHLENVSVVYADPSGRWTLSGYVNNIENYAVKTSFMSGAGGGTLMLGDPRTYGGILSVKF